MPKHSYHPAFFAANKLMSTKSLFLVHYTLGSPQFKNKYVRKCCLDFIFFNAPFRIYGLISASEQTLSIYFYNAYSLHLSL